MSAGIDITGILRGIGEAKRRAEAAALRSMDRFGEHVIGDSQQLCPVDTGALQGSGTTLPAELKGGKIEKTIGHNTNYAAAVHERLDQHHEKGQAKFLETAIRNNAPKLGEFVGSEVKKALG